MNSQVYFENIRERIIETLDQCEFDLKIAVAWFTDTKLLSKVEELSRRGVNVKIIIYDDHINQKQLFEKLYYNGAEVFLSRKLMHNKFCIIDGKTIINGSYNWTYSASTNEENINVVSNNKEFAEKFVLQFFKLKRNCNTINDFFDYSRNSLRLLEEEFEIFYQKKVKSELPYFLNLVNIEFSDENISYQDRFENGYYFIKDEKTEVDLYWFICFLNSKHSVKKLCSIYGKEAIETQVYQHVKGFEDKNGIINFNGEKHFIHDVTSKGVVFINRKGVIEERINYLYRFRNGLYLISQENNFMLTDFNNSELSLNMRALEAHDDFGIVASKKNTKYGTKEKIGLIDVNGKEIIEFKFDHFEVNPKNNIIHFHEQSHIYYSEVRGRLGLSKSSYGHIRTYRLFRENEKKELPYKLTSFNYINGDFIVDNNLKCEFLDGEKYVEIFLTDKDEIYLELYLAVTNQCPEFDFTFLKNNIESIDELEKLREKYHFYIEGIKSTSRLKRFEVLMQLQDQYKSFDEINRRHKTGKYAPKNEGCYIATMVYEDYNHPKVIILRVFRDKILLKYTLGKWFVSKYYKYSPIFVERFQNSFWVKPTRVFVEIIVFVLDNTNSRKYK